MAPPSISGGKNQLSWPSHPECSTYKPTMTVTAGMLKAQVYEGPYRKIKSKTVRNIWIKQRAWAQFKYLAKDMDQTATSNLTFSLHAYAHNG
ncbi:hypothetical protein SUGI_0114430 [Cryptomeria japonica]|nr:hypothetical protein SUGI_0114430 [Cryptomeria japonica]